MPDAVTPNPPSDAEQVVCTVRNMNRRPHPMKVQTRTKSTKRLRSPTTDLSIGAAFQSRFDGWVNKISPSVVPLLQAKNGKPEANGSAILLNLNGRALIVAAAHVLDVESLWHYNLDRTLVPMIANFKCLRQVDVAAAELSPEQVRAFSRNKFLVSEDIRPAVTTGNYYGSAIGFPATKTEVVHGTTRVRAKPFSISHLVRSNTRTEIAIAFEKRRVEEIAARVQHTAPDPIGMSGGGFFIAKITAACPDRVHLAGIATHWKRDRQLLIATPIETVLTFLGDAFP